MAGAFKICNVKSNLQGVRQEQLVLKHKRGTCFTRGYRFYVCQFDIRVIVAPADLRFELWFAGEKFSGNHEPITYRLCGIKKKGKIRNEQIGKERPGTDEPGMDRSGKDRSGRHRPGRGRPERDRSGKYDKSPVLAVQTRIGMAIDVTSVLGRLAARKSRLK